MTQLDLKELFESELTHILGGVGGGRPLDPPPGENPDDPDGKCNSRTGL